MTKIAKNTVCLWFDRDAEAAARFYASTFPDSFVTAVHRAPGDFPSGKQGDVLTVEFTVMGIPCLGLNGGPAFTQDEAFSFQVATEDQAETDRYWNAIIGNGGRASACGWCKDRWGVSWQITPVALTRAITHPDATAAKRAFDAMMTMGKIDIAAIEAAVRGDAARITVETTVRAPLDTVWRAYTTPADILAWNAASDDWHTTRASVDLRPGGAFCSRMEAKDGSFGFDFEGTYTQVVPGRLIEYDFGDRKARVEFTDGAEGVHVRVGFDAEQTHSIEQQREGWQAILDRFKAHVEAKA